MKASTILIVLVVLFSIGCSGKSEHGHEHGPDTHVHDDESSEPVEQEEFTVPDDSTSTEGTHTHDDGSTHDDH